MACNSNCLSCAVANSVQTCLLSNCGAGYYLTGSNICAICTGSTGSQAGTVGTSSTCSIACGNTDCASCSISSTGSKTCIAANCQAGKYYDSISSSCLQCTGGTGSSSNSMTCSITCTTANCNTCDSTTCLSCLAGYIPSNGNCAICTGGKGSKTGDSSCSYNCASGCSACSVSTSGVQTCLTSACQAGYYFDNNQQKCLQCSGGFGSQANKLACTIACYSGCSSCSVGTDNSQTCLVSTCSVGTYASDTSLGCVSCPTGKGSAANSIGSNSCFTCDSSCSSCFLQNSPSACIKCSNTLFTNQNGTCQFNSTCSPGFLPDTNLSICYQCSSNCLDCNHILINLCTSCSGSLNLNPVTQSCVINCPNGYYPLNNKCNPCPNGCSSC